MCLTAEMYRVINLGDKFCCDRKAANRQRLLCVSGSGLYKACHMAEFYVTIPC